MIASIFDATIPWGAVIFAAFVLVVTLTNPHRENGTPPSRWD